MEDKKDLTMYLATPIMYLVTRKEGRRISPQSRADYFKERRKKTRNFSVEIERKKFERLEEKLSKQNKTKTQWLNEKIDKELDE